MVFSVLILNLQAINVLVHLFVLLCSGNVLSHGRLHPTKGRASARLLLMGTPAPP